ncbi:MAG: hypothetical protein K2I20_03540 [Clostridia bacterium]|nr:hypothetical protein [Clostridia bacterium]
MKKSMILELAGENCYFDNINFADNEEYNKRLNELRKMFEKFCGEMTEKEKD